MTALTVSRGLFRTRYVLNYKLDGEPESDWFVRRAMDSLRVSIAVTLPAEPQRHTADRTEVDGRKLIWEFRGDPGPMAMRANLVQWRIWRIVGIAAIFALFGAWVVARIQGGTPWIPCPWGSVAPESLGPDVFDGSAGKYCGGDLGWFRLWRMTTVNHRGRLQDRRQDGGSLRRFCEKRIPGGLRFLIGGVVAAGLTLHTGLSRAQSGSDAGDVDRTPMKVGYYYLLRKADHVAVARFDAFTPETNGVWRFGFSIFDPDSGRWSEQIQAPIRPGRRRPWAFWERNKIPWNEADVWYSLGNRALVPTPSDLRFLAATHKPRGAIRDRVDFVMHGDEKTTVELGFKCPDPIVMPPEAGFSNQAIEKLNAAHPAKQREASEASRGRPLRVMVEGEARMGPGSVDPNGAVAIAIAPPSFQARVIFFFSCVGAFAGAALAFGVRMRLHRRGHRLEEGESLGVSCLKWGACGFIIGWLAVAMVACSIVG